MTTPANGHAWLHVYRMSVSLRPEEVERMIEELVAVRGAERSDAK